MNRFSWASAGTISEAAAAASVTVADAMTTIHGTTNGSETSVVKAGGIDLLDLLKERLLAAGVAEALVQSHAGEISLLPALPAGWDDGSVAGLRARGEYDVSMQWKGGKLQAADIHSIKGGAIKVRYGQKVASLTIKPGEVVHLNADLVAAN